METDIVSDQLELTVYIEGDSGKLRYADLQYSVGRKVRDSGSRGI